MLALVRGEVFKLTHRLMTRVLLLIVFATPIAASILLGTTGNGKETDGVGDFRLAAVHDNGMVIVYQLALVTTIVLTASIVASEFSWGTIRTLLPRTAGRAPFLTAKLVIVFGYLIVAVGLGFTSALLGSGIVTLIKGLDTDLGSNFWGLLSGALLRAGLAVLPYAAIAFVVALWTRSSAAGIAVPIVVFYAEVLLTPAFTSVSALDWLPNVLIYSANVSSLLDSDAVLDKADLPSHVQAAGVLAAYVVTCVSVAYARFLTRDIT